MFLSPSRSLLLVVDQISGVLKLFGDGQVMAAALRQRCSSISLEQQKAEEQLYLIIRRQSS